MSYDELIYRKAIDLGMPPVLSTFIVAQARHETAGYTSRVFQQCKNAFGYKYVGQQTAAGACLMSPELNPYARYNSVADSVAELVAWIRRRQRDGRFPADLTEISSPEQYAGLLKSAGYYTATIAEYASGLVYWLKNIIEKYPKPALTLSTIVIIALGVLAFREIKKK